MRGQLPDLCGLSHPCLHTLRIWSVGSHFQALSWLIFTHVESHGRPWIYGRGLACCIAGFATGLWNGCMGVVGCAVADVWEHCITGLQQQPRSTITSCLSVTVELKQVNLHLFASRRGLRQDRTETKYSWSEMKHMWQGMLDD